MAKKSENTESNDVIDASFDQASQSNHHPNPSRKKSKTKTKTKSKKGKIVITLEV